MSGASGKTLWLTLCLACVVLLTAAQPASATYIITENFDSAPANWVGGGNWSAPQNFGWSNSNYAEGAASGEAGGAFSRNTLASYWTDVGSLDISSDGLSLSGQGRFTNISGEGNSILGWYDQNTSLDWVPDNYVCIRTDNDNVYMEYVANGGTLYNVQLAGPLGTENSWSFELNYDPSGNSGGGTITGSVNGGTAQVINLAAGDKDAMTNLNRFGLMTLHNGGDNTIVAYYDDLSYTSAVPEPGTLALLVAGLIGLLCYAWRKRR